MPETQLRVAMACEVGTRAGTPGGVDCACQRPCSGRLLIIKLHSQGCVAAVRRVLGNLEGVDKVDIDLAQQKVTVLGSADRNAVKEVVAKSGKKTDFWS